MTPSNIKDFADGDSPNSELFQSGVGCEKENATFEYFVLILF